MVDVRQIVQEEILAARQQAGYGTSLVPWHNHDGVNSPTLFSGRYYGTSANPPQNWSVTNPTLGKYTVTHNLGTARYGVLITVNAGGAGNTYTWETNNESETAFDVFTALAGVGAHAADFSFIVFLYDKHS